MLFLNTVLLMDIAFLPFAAAVLSAAFRTGHGQRTAVVFHGMAFLLAAVLFNVIWGYARHDQRLLATTIDSVGARAIGRRFRLALVWLGTGTLLGALVPVLGMAVIASFIPYYWRPIRGELPSAKPRRRAAVRPDLGTRAPGRRPGALCAPRGIRTPNRQIRRLVVYVHTVSLSAICAAQVRCRIQLDLRSPV